MSEKVQAIRATSLPDAVVSTFQEFETNRHRIQQQQYRPEKESAELGALATRTAEALVGQLGRGILDSEKKRDEQLLEIDAELERARDIPNRRSGQTDTEHVAVLVRRQIQEAQRAAALTLTAMDVATVSSSTNPDVVLEILETSLASAPSDAALRIRPRM